MDGPPLLILGASGRAAASSAARAGFAPIVVDLFADRDLTARFPARRVDRDDYPGGLARIAERLPDAPWIYTGAVENHPGLIDRIAARRPLLGIGGEALRALRDPARWTSALRDAGLPALEVRLAGDPPPTRGRWLAKPLASGGGRGIRRWVVGSGPVPTGSYLQARAPGRSLAAIFLGSGRSARLEGVTRQLLARNDAGLAVAYRGSVGPWPVPPETSAAIARIGHALASAFGLLGLFGVDLAADGARPFAVEVNPRYTASVEVLEAALGRSLLGGLAREIPAPEPIPRGSPGAAAKRILFARHRFEAPREWPWTDPADPLPTVADLPAPGTLIEPGEPVLTVLARGPTATEALARLAGRAALWRRRIDAWARDFPALRD